MDATRVSTPTLDVIVPVLDEERTIGVLLDRLCCAHEDDDRARAVIVVDGGSRDRTVELAVERGARVVSSARGRGAQLAHGAAQSDAQWLVFLHADCVPRLGALARLREHLRSDPFDVGAFRQVIDAPGWFFRAVERAANARARRGMIYGDSGLIVRRDVYVESGGFRPLPLFEDVDLSRRLKLRSPTRWLADAELLISARRWRAEGALRATIRNWMLWCAFEAGVSPSTLARFYPPHVEPPAHP